MEVMKRLNEKHEEAYLTTANQFSFSLEKGTKANKIRFVLKALQDGATIPAVTDWLNQLADNIKIAIGNKTVMEFDPIEYYAYLKRKKLDAGLSFIGDGTGASTHVGIFIFDLSLAPLDRFLVNGMNPDYGFDSKQKVNFTIEYPADANKLDTRLLDVYAVSLPNSNPTKVMEFEQITKTMPSTGKDQIMALSQNAKKKLFEVVIKQTSYLSEGGTVDDRTIEEVSYQEDNEDNELFDMRIEHFNQPFHSANIATGIMIDDDEYVIIPFHHDDDGGTSKQLTKSSQLSVNVGVAEAVTWQQHRIVPLNIYSV